MGIVLKVNIWIICWCDENSKKYLKIQRKKSILKIKKILSIFFKKFENSKTNKKTSFIEINNAEIEVVINSSNQKWNI